MKGVLEIRWHGRGGQGVKTAATMVAELAMEGGKFTQGFPEYGPERMGAPVRGYTRVSEKPILIHCDITRPDVVVVLDDTLVGTGGLADGMGTDGILLVNTKEPPQEIRKRTGLKGGKVYTADATKISLDELGRSIPNAPMMGALARISGVLDIEKLLAGIKKKFEHKFGDKVVQGNVRAVRRGYEEVVGEE